jgi:hypothetical protein
VNYYEPIRIESTAGTADPRGLVTRTRYLTLGFITKGNRLLMRCMAALSATFFNYFS